MRFLCIDTSAGAGVGLVDIDQSVEVLAKEVIADQRRHAEALNELIRRVVKQGSGKELAEAGIETIAVGTGPAPFTGLRAGLVSARVIGEVLDARVLGICSLDVLARQALDQVRDRKVLVATDGKRKEVYAGLYEAAGPDDVTALWGPEVGPAESFFNKSRGEDPFIVGAGAELYPEALPPSAQLADTLDPVVMARIGAARLAREAGGEEADFSSEPLYLRRPDIHPGVAAKVAAAQKGRLGLLNE